MERKDFDKFFDNVVTRYAEEIISLDDVGCLKFRPNRRAMVFYLYQTKRDEIRKEYMRPKERKALDRHKVASCMMYALMQSKLIKVNRFIPGLSETMLMANECLAFNAALNIVEQYKRQDDCAFSKNYEIIIPSTYHNKGNGNSFISNTLKALYYIPYFARFDVFAYSTIFFLLESRTDIIKELGVTESERSQNQKDKSSH